jgi:hypothetical protein
MRAQTSQAQISNDEQAIRQMVDHSLSAYDSKKECRWPMGYQP